MPAALCKIEKLEHKLNDKCKNDQLQTNDEFLGGTKEVDDVYSSVSRVRDINPELANEIQYFVSSLEYRISCLKHVERERDLALERVKQLEAQLLYWRSLYKKAVRANDERNSPN